MANYEEQLTEVEKARREFIDAIVKETSPFFIPILEFLNRLITKLNRRR